MIPNRVFKRLHVMYSVFMINHEQVFKKYFLLLGSKTCFPYFLISVCPGVVPARVLWKKLVANFTTSWREP